MKKRKDHWLTPLKVLWVGAGIAASVILVPVLVSAVAPAANTVIGNQAAATYTDASGRPQFASSNTVTSTVAQIGGTTLSNDGTKTAAAGNTVSIPHTLTNTGNGNDSFTITSVPNTTLGTFSNVAMYADPNGTGVPSGTALCATPAVGAVPTCTTGFMQAVGGNGGVFNFIASYTIPPTATTPLAPFNTSTVTVAPVASSPSIPYPPGTVSRTDTVNLTANAAFSASKALKAPAVAAPGTLTAGWPAAATGGKASDASCAATVAGVNAAAANCTYTVYTIDYYNTGGLTGSFSMSDTLPSGFTYVPGTAVWSGKGGTALSESGALTGSAPNVMSSTFAAGKFSATVSNVAPNTAGSISFVVQVNSTALAGSSTTTNTALYATTTCDSLCASTPATQPATPTNPSPYPVTSTYKVIAANASTASTFDSAVPPNKATPDLVEVTAPAFLGSRVPFTNWVINKGNASDTFNVAIDPANTNFPVGTSFAFFKADGATPLLDTNGDGKPDTGALAPNASVAIVVVATLPGTGAVPAGAVNALMTATSVASAGVFDSVWEQLDTIKSAKVDVTNTSAGNLASTNGGAATVACTAGSNCDLGQGPSTNPTFTTPTTTGTAASFPLYITNEVPSATTTYNLSYSAPPGYTVKFVDASAGTCASAPAITAIAITAGTTADGPSATPGTNQKEVLACVTPPAGTATGTVPVSFTATSSTDPTATDTITDAVQVSQPVVIAPAMQLGPNNSTGTTPNGGTTVAPVTLTNTGNTSCGLNTGFNVSVTLDSASQTAGWAASVFFDANKNAVIDPTDVLINTSVAGSVANLTSAIATGLIPLAPAPGNTLGLPLLVKLFAPMNATIGATATATLTVTDLNNSPTTAAPLCPPTSARYSVTVTNGQLSVQKSQALSAPATYLSPNTCNGAAAVTFAADSLSTRPGDCIIYKVMATNTGNAPVTNVVLSDSIPAYTLYNATQPAAQCADSSGATPTFTPVGTPVTSVSCSGVTVPPLGTLTLYYAVQVQQ